MSKALKNKRTVKKLQTKVENNDDVIVTSQPVMKNQRQV